MEKVATVYYDGEVFRPEAPVALESNTGYVISIEAVPIASISEEPSAKVETAWDVLDRLTGTIDGLGDDDNAKAAKVGTLSELLVELAGTVEAPPDWSAEHDHYIHGTPKRHEGHAS